MLEPRWSEEERWAQEFRGRSERDKTESSRIEVGFEDNMSFQQFAGLVKVENTIFFSTGICKYNQRSDGSIWDALRRICMQFSVLGKSIFEFLDVARCGSEMTRMYDFL